MKKFNFIISKNNYNFNFLLLSDKYAFIYEKELFFCKSFIDMGFEFQLITYSFFIDFPVG